MIKRAFGRKPFLLFKVHGAVKKVKIRWLIIHLKNNLLLSDEQNDFSCELLRNITKFTKIEIKQIKNLTSFCKNNKLLVLLKRIFFLTLYFECDNLYKVV